MDSAETIVAISTPPGTGGVGIVRLSGPRAIDLGRALFRTKPPLGSRIRHVEYGKIHAHGCEVDTGLAWAFEKPHSYTGEDTVEISCHGSPLILELVVNEAIKQGARLAEAGEFTRRAFLNGRLDLLQAEAVIDLIQAGSEGGLEDAYGLAGGRLSTEVRQLKAGLVRVLARIEIGLDFSEEDIDAISHTEVIEDLRRTLVHAKRLVDSFTAGIRRQQGYLVVLTGRPNVGKSTLFNSLLDEDRAIVTPIPGTTRDLVEGKTNWQGRTIRFVDTAGMRDSSDPIEIEGIDRARKVVTEADLVIVVADASVGWSEEDERLVGPYDVSRCLVALNKMDLPRLELDSRPSHLARTVVEISALTGSGKDSLIQKILEMLPQDHKVDGAVLTRQRHQDCISRMARQTEVALEMIRVGEPDECIAVELQDGLVFLGELLGEGVGEDLLDSIFSEFCIGK